MPTKKISSNKSSRRRLNTGSALSGRQDVTPLSTEVDTSTSSTPSLSLRGNAESAEVSTSLIGQPLIDTLGSVVPNQSGLVEARISKRRDRSPSEISDGRAANPRGNPSSDRGNPSNSSRGNPSDQGSPGDFLESSSPATAEHTMSLKDITQPRSSHQVVYDKGHPTSNAILCSSIHCIQHTYYTYVRSHITYVQHKVHIHPFVCSISVASIVFHPMS